MDRLLGRIEGNSDGPLIICIAALHGNEQIGIHAFRNVYSSLTKHQIPVKGKLLGLLGNIQALKNDQRYLDYDLNRCWTPEKIEQVKVHSSNESPEDSELRALCMAIDKELSDAYTQTIIVDLHATSSENGNFLVVPEGIAKEEVVKAVKLPIVVNLEKYLEGTLLEYYYQKGCLSFAFEGGSLGTSASYHLHTSGLWELLDKAGAISHHDHVQEDHYIQQLEEVSAGLPDLVVARYRHQVSKHDGFSMLPGFHNFQRITKGQQLALDNHGPIISPMDGMIFLPLYQSAGDDGFFIVEEV